MAELLFLSVMFRTFRPVSLPIAEDDSDESSSAMGLLFVSHRVAAKPDPLLRTMLYSPPRRTRSNADLKAILDFSPSMRPNGFQRFRSPRGEPSPHGRFIDPGHRHARQSPGAGPGSRDAGPAGGRPWLGGGEPAPVDHQDHRRRHPGPAPVGGRRQGAVHPGTRHRPAGGLHRSGRALRQGPADRPAGGHRDRRLPTPGGRARRLHRPALQEPEGPAAGRGGGPRS